ncbi:MAG: hypothetical protein IJR61_05255 [Clostridia bacterium]|nr:hypothetical protein [Clostridia bacterium]
MMKSKGKITALIVSFVLALGIFASCNLVEVNVKKDMEQKVATVQVDGADAEDIYKRELVNGLISYGYTYVQNYGYSLSQTYELILNNLVNNKVVVQYARLELSKANETDGDTAKAGYLDLPAEELRTAPAKGRIEYIEKLLPYLKPVQVAQAVYNVKSSFNSLIDSFDTSKTSSDTEKEDESVTARSVPTVKTKTGTAVDEDYVKANDDLEKGVTEDELDDTQRSAYDAWLIGKYNSYSMAVTTAARKSAVNEFISTFKANGLVTEDEITLLEKKNKQYELNGYVYYLDLLASGMESLIVSNYEKYLNATAEGMITNDGLWTEYLGAYNSQKKAYADLSAYETAISSATEDSFILYNPEMPDGVKYGYIANLLLGFSEEAQSDLKNFKASATSQADIIAHRDNLLRYIRVADQRATWLQNGYYELTDKEHANEADYYEFGSDYAKYLKTYYGTFEDLTDYSSVKTANKYHLDGTEWKWGETDEEDYKANFRKIYPTEYTVDDFLANVFGTTLTVASAAAVPYSGAATVGTITFDDETLAKINDLLYAFSTDPGSISGSNAYGYLYSPKTSAKQYVKEYADAAKVLVEAGVGNYAVVATEYGYHVMICTKVVEPSGNNIYGDASAEETAKAAFIADLETEDTVAYRYRKTKVDANVEKLVSDIVTYNISKYVDEDGKDYAVTKYAKSYKNLISDSGN